MKKERIWKLLIYFIFYSVIGFFMETVYAIFTKGLLESRQSFLYGPFCIVYGIGAVCLTFFLEKYKNKNLKLFIGGIIIGCIIEYYSSYIGEVFMHVKWWDYSNEFLNINGRTCAYYAFCWGGLTIILINYINPFFNKYVCKIKEKYSSNLIKFVTMFIFGFMILDGIITCFAIDNFLTRTAKEYNIKISGIDDNKKIDFGVENLFSNEKMVITYPNMMIVKENQENVYLENIFPIMKNYYYKFEK